MRIALEATAACRPVRTGIARYSIELMGALDRLAAERGGVDRIEHFFRLSRRWKRGHACPELSRGRARWFQEPLPPLGGVDLVHGLDGRVPRWPGARRVATVHDVIALVAPEGLAESTRRHLVGHYRQAARRAHRVLAVSEATRRELLDHFDVPPERVEVVHHGVSPAFAPQEPEAVRRVRERLGLARPYFLFVGELAPRKNPGRLVRAWAASPAAREIDLVLAGARGPGAGELEALAGPGLAARLHVLGYVPDALLPCLYAGAEGFLFPSLHEGFGLPVLEALRCGTPVLGGAVGAVPEVAGGHAVLVDPLDVDAIRAGLEALPATEPAERERGRRHAERFTWEACARATRDAYDRALVAV